MSQHTETAKQSQRSTNYGTDANHLPAEPTLTDVAEQTLDSIRVYAKQRPEVLAIWCFGIGFVVGWKLKPW